MEDNKEEDAVGELTKLISEVTTYKPAGNPKSLKHIANCLSDSDKDALQQFLNLKITGNHFNCLNYVYQCSSKFLKTVHSLSLIILNCFSRCQLNKNLSFLNLIFNSDYIQK